jgi:uncharacterized protein (TIGR03083 family)
MTDDAQTWVLIHSERSAMADTLGTLTTAQWAEPSLCAGWTVKLAAAHILAGAEQTAGSFLTGMAGTGFRFNTLMDRRAHVLGELGTTEIVDRIRARTTTTNHPPAPVMAMLGEIVVHGEDIRRPLGLSGTVDPRAVTACLEMYKSATFPVGGRKRMQGLRLTATDVDWSHGEGPEVSGSGTSLLLAMTGRAVSAGDLTGDGAPVLESRTGTRRGGSPVSS